MPTPTQTHIILPTSSTEQGHAFEELILSYYQKSGRYTVREWSSYLHGSSGKWWQCDGIVENETGRYLVEAKFFRDRPATVRDINPDRRQAAAQDLDCSGLLYISLNGFTSEMLDWSHVSGLDVHYFTWSDLRSPLLSDLSQYASVLLDQFDLKATYAATGQDEAALHFDEVTPIPYSAQFPEFITVPNKLELWLRRMPRLSLQREQNAAGQFWYDSETGQVTLLPDRTGDLSLQEAWTIQDAISGYASRTYKAVRATAEALSTLDDGLLSDIQAVLHTRGWKTGLSGIRSALDFLVLMQLARKWLDGRKARYVLTPLGQAYTAGGRANDDLFATVLQNWLPYQAMAKAIVEHAIPPTADDILRYFKAQYAPYEPYARSLFNPNKADGLIRLYKIFGPYLA